MKRPEPKSCDALAVGRRAREAVERWLDGVRLQPRLGFSDRIEKFAATLALWGASTNLTANPDDPGEIGFHIIDSLAPVASAYGADRDALETALAPGGSVLDIGSGAGFPGLVLAAACEAHFILAETRRKRASFLEVAAREMGLENVGIDRRRADPHAFSRQFDLMTVRAFGPMPDVYRIGASAVRPGGLILLYASSGQDLDTSSAEAAGLAGPRTWTYQVPHGAHPADRTAALWRKQSGHEACGFAAELKPH